MFYITELKDHIRVAPKHFEEDITESVRKCVRLKYDGFIDEDVGIVVDVVGVKQVGEGVIISGDGAAYYETTFELLVFKPDIHEVVYGKIKDIADFGAFMLIGPVDGMIHISQTMDDYVSFEKDKVLSGKDTKRVLKVGDACKARIIAVSFKDLNNPKIGLTMRQPGLGKPEWSIEEVKPAAKKKVKSEE